MNAHALIMLALSMPSAAAAATTVEPWPLPVTAAASQPSLGKGPDGTLNLTWIERRGEGHRLRMAHYRDGRWLPAATIAEGGNWFVNWADFPSSTQLPDGTLWAHNLVKSGDGAYAYDVVLYRSKDGGTTWSKPVTVNDDGTATEHGFATLWPWSRSELAIAWLDGRQTAGGTAHDGHGSGHDVDLGKAMTLHAGVFDGNGRKLREWPLDTSTCDCCQTDSALTDDGPIVVYRDRDAREVRDIHSTRFARGKWQMPKPVAADGWIMPACPVNGPAVAAAGRKVWAAWYTAAGGVPAVRLAYSSDAGAGFSKVRRFKRGAELQGRVDLSADPKGAWLLWTEERDRQTLWLQRLDTALRSVGPPVRVATLAGRGRATGFARMQHGDGALYVVWTDVIAGKPALRGARIPAAH